MIRAITALALTATAATAQVSEGTMCAQKPDRAEIVQHPTKPGAYLFTYFNSPHECSRPRVAVTVAAPDGFTVTMWVTVGVDSENRERIEVIPEDPTYQAWPAELLLRDSAEPGQIEIIAGVS